MNAYTIKARPTKYKGIQMRSRLEARFAESLDRVGCSWEYEPECFADETGQYLPDFVIRCARTSVYIEVKPTSRAASDALTGRMPVILSSDPEAEIWAASPLKMDPPHAPNTHRWFLRSPEQPFVDGVAGVTQALHRAGTDFEQFDVEGYQVVRVVPSDPNRLAAHIVVAPSGSLYTQTWIAVHAALGDSAWVLHASGAKGGWVPMTEYNAKGEETDRYSRGHSFTMSDADWLGSLLSGLEWYT
jgi:hypothetical protein